MQLRAGGRGQSREFRLWETWNSRKSDNHEWVVVNMVSRGPIYLNHLMKRFLFYCCMYQLSVNLFLNQAISTTTYLTNFCKIARLLVIHRLLFISNWI